MRALDQYVAESVFDTESDVKGLISRWVESALDGDFKFVVTKAGVRLTGNAVLTIDDEYIPDLFVINQVKGNIYIENCPNLKNIKNLFTERADVSGSISITNCPKLDSLEGLPYKCGDLQIIDCRSLRSLKGICEYIEGDLDLIKVGKRFSKDEVKKYVKVGPYQYNEENMIREGLEQIDESVNDPHILRFIDYVNNVLKYEKGWIKDLVGRENYQMRLDKVTPSMVHVFKWGEDEKKRLTYARKIISENITGFIILYDTDMKPTEVIVEKRMARLKKFEYMNRLSFGKFSTTELINTVRNAYKVVVVIPVRDAIGRQNISYERQKNRAGVINPGDVNQYKEIAEANIKRYKTLLIKMREEKINGFNKYSKMISNIMKRYSDAFEKALSKSNFNVLQDLASMNSMIGGNQYIDSKTKWQVRGTNGILTLYKDYCWHKEAMDRGGDAQYYSRRLRELEQDLELAIKNCENKLVAIESDLK